MERKGDPVAAGGVGGLLRLRWPAGHREVAGTAGLLLAGVVGCSLGPRVSRVRFPGVSGEAAAAPRWNKSSRALSHPFGASLRCYQRARGGGAPVVELVYRRCSPAARRPEREVSALGFCLVNREAALGLVEAWRMEQIQSSRGGSGRRRWICIQGLRSSGRVPGRWIYSVGFTSSTSTSAYCGSSKKLQIDRAPADLGLEATVREDRRRWQTAAVSGVQMVPAGS